MSHRTLFLLLVSLVCTGTASRAQRSAVELIDSLKQALARPLAPNEKAKLYGDLAWHYNSVSLDSAFAYGQAALQMARQIGDRKLTAQSLSDLGAIHFVKGDVDQSLDCYNQSLQIRQADRDEGGIASLHFNIGGAYYKKSALERAMTHYLEALQYYEKAGNENVVANLHSNIAVAYTALRNYPKALTYLQGAQAYFEQHGQDGPLANTLLAMGNVHYALLDTAEAIRTYTKTLDVAKRASNALAESSAYNNLGSIYTDLGQHRLAIAHIQRSLDIRNHAQLESDAASSNVTLAINHTKLGNYQQARALLMSSLHHYRQAGVNEKLSVIYFQLIAVHAALRNADSVFHYMNRYTASQSAELNSKVIEVSNELETKYQTEKKEQQIEILNQETAIQQLRLKQRGLLLAIALGVLLAGGLVAYLVFKQRKLRADARLQQELSKQGEQATRDILDAEERERRRIAGDLHDGVGQTLSAALLNLDYLQKSVAGSDGAVSELVDNAVAMVRDSYQEMRSISHQMMPNALLKAGLGSSIKEFLAAIDGQRIKVHLSVSGLEQRLDQQLETVLYRAVQEAVNNVIKHAQASRLTIQLMKDEEGISATIEDNGRGFDPAASGHVEGIGLKNMRSRIALLQGSVDVDAVPGKGTVIVIYVPL